MVYTKTVKGKSQNVTITGVAQSLADLLGVDVPDPDVTNEVKLFFKGTLAGANPIAWCTEDQEVVPAPQTGVPVYVGVEITITKANFDSFKIIKNGGADFDMWCAQFDYETLTT